jgi:endonuclease/exonuclease/phosphatase family metal-dependent hydrolase
VLHAACASSAARPARRGVILVVASVLVLAIAPVARAGSGDAPRRFVAMTQNLYLGADLQPLFGQSGAGLIVAAAAAYAHVEQTDFPARARAIAAEIARDLPDVVGLQEVALWQRGSDPQHLSTTYDFLDILLHALAERGLAYRAVAVDVNFSGTLPIALDLSDWAGFTDRDAIIVRSGLPTSDIKVSNPTAQNFQAKLVVPLNGSYVEVPRGWSTVDVKFRGKSYRFADTHLEAYSAVVRDAQAEELASVLSASPLPVVLVGDINSPPDDVTGPYGILAAAGFGDSWIEAMGNAPGWTSGQPDSLDCSAPSTIDHRIDYLLHDAAGFVDAVVGTGDVVGDEQADCTVGTNPPLWPSDHAGVVITLHVARP